MACCGSPRNMFVGAKDILGGQDMMSCFTCLPRPASPAWTSRLRQVVSQSWVKSWLKDLDTDSKMFVSSHRGECGLRSTKVFIKSPVQLPLSSLDLLRLDCNLLGPLNHLSISMKSPSLSSWSKHSPWFACSPLWSSALSWQLAAHTQAQPQLSKKYHSGQRWKIFEMFINNMFDITNITFVWTSTS